MVLNINDIFLKMKKMKNIELIFVKNFIKKNLNKGQVYHFIHEFKMKILYSFELTC